MSSSRAGKRPACRDGTRPASRWRSSTPNIRSMYASSTRCLQQTYEQELKMGYLITLFSIVAILISIVGVFGLVVFESGYRRKEIAIRKVFGSTTGEILLMVQSRLPLYLINLFRAGCTGGMVRRQPLAGELRLSHADVRVGTGCGCFWSLR